MKRFLIRKKITAVLLILVMIGLPATMSFEQEWIEGYGFIQKLLGKREVNDFEVVMGEDGVLYNSYFSTGINGELDDVTDTIEQIADIARESGSEFLVVAPPDKFLEGRSEYTTGYPYNYSNENMDYYLNRLKDKGIDALDLRETLINHSTVITDVFYRTDHHWTTTAAFYAFVEMLNYMEQNYQVTFLEKEKITDITQYGQEIFQKVFLGSQGRKTGLNYSGLDDFTVIYPSFLTHLTFTIPDYSYESFGRFEYSVVDYEFFSKELNVYEKDWYGMYTKSVGYPFGTIINHMNEEGPKLLMIRDSFSSVPAAFLSLAFSQVDLLYPYLYEGNLTKLIQDGEYDYVIVMAYPGNYSRSFFTFDFSVTKE